MDSLTLVLPYSAYSGQNDKFWNVIEWPARTKREREKRKPPFTMELMLNRHWIKVSAETKGICPNP